MGMFDVKSQFDEIQDLMDEDKTISFIDKFGNKWGMMMVTRSTAPSHATRSWVIGGGDENVASDPEKSIQELGRIWAERSWREGPGVSTVQSVKSGKFMNMKMVVFWPIDKECKHA